MFFWSMLGFTGSSSTLRPGAILSQGFQSCQEGSFSKAKYFWRENQVRGLFSGGSSAFTAMEWFPLFLALPVRYDLFFTLFWRSTWGIQCEYDCVCCFIFLPLLLMPAFFFCLSFFIHSKVCLEDFSICRPQGVQCSPPKMNRHHLCYWILYL